MDSGVGIFRNEQGIRKTCDKLAELIERFANIKIEDNTSTFNTEVTVALELEGMLEVAQALSHCALDRKESRGSHQRSDFTDRDDGNYLKHSMAHYTGDIPKIDYKDVIITKWPPAERVYGR
ncbi:hypothetical protein IIB79_03440 [candidate division KSB1 bacterium]|nr:hypothetical protein [candidate division KSB1 bacterium]